MRKILPLLALLLLANPAPGAAADDQGGASPTGAELADKLVGAWELVS